jgi:hypothetical protein
MQPDSLLTYKRKFSPLWALLSSLKAARGAHESAGQPAEGVGRASHTPNLRRNGKKVTWFFSYYSEVGDLPISSANR